MLHFFRYSLIITLLLLMSCSSDEYKEALSAYDLAKSEKNIEELTRALNILAEYVPEKYRNELIKAEHARALLTKAQEAQVNEDDYAAYLASHESYRSTPNQTAKYILKASGAKFFPILQAHLALENSFLLRSENLTSLFKKHRELPVKEWDLLTVNKEIEQLSLAAVELEKALKLIDSLPHKLNIPQLSIWQSAIEDQLALVKKARDYLPQLGKYKSAKKLLQLNHELNNHSTELLSLVRPSFALESMNPIFLKAQGEYEHFQLLLENLSLAQSLSDKDLHVSWYKSWRSIENATLNPGENFVDYPKNSKQRSIEINVILSQSLELPKINEDFINIELINKKAPLLTKLLIKLKRDKALIQ